MYTFKSYHISNRVSFWLGKLQSYQFWCPSFPVPKVKIRSKMFTASPFPRTSQRVIQVNMFPKVQPPCQHVGRQVHGEIYSQLCSWQHNTCNVRVHFPFYIVLLSSHHICFSHYSNWQYRLPIQRRNSIPATKLTQILRPPATNNPRPRNWNSHRTALQLLCVWSPVPFLSNVNSLPRQVACTAQAILQTAAVPKLPKFVDPEPTGPIRFTCQVRSAGGRIWMCPFCTGETCSWFSPLQMTGVITTVFLYILNFFGI